MKPLLPGNLFSKLLAATVLATTLCAASRAEQPACPQFQNGDRVCFIGDSITDIGLYHSYLQLFYATRFPSRAIAYSGAGHSGGNSRDCLNRVSWDILPNQPTVATVMFGMNDMNGGKQASATSDGEAENAIAQRIEEVQVNYEKLLDALAAQNIRLILLGPSIYDGTAKFETPPVPYRNLALTRWTERLREIATRRHAGFVDIGTLMNQVNLRIQENNPKATLTSGDRVHGKGMGNIVMTYSILKAQGITPYVSRICVDAGTGKTDGLQNCTLSDIERSPAGLAFTCLEDALPFVPSKAAAEGIKLVPFNEELNQEILSVTSLPPGRYDLKIDDAQAGNYTSEELAAGINLAINSKTPQYRQAEALCLVNEERHEILGYLRALPFLRHALYGDKIDPNDEAQVDQFLKSEYDKRKPGDFVRHMIEVYLIHISGQRQYVERRYAELVAKMADDRTPKAHRFTLLRENATPETRP